MRVKGVRIDARDWAWISQATQQLAYYDISSLEEYLEENSLRRKKNLKRGLGGKGGIWMGLNN